MADFLTHVFLPLTAVYVLRQEIFDSPYMLTLAGFGLLPDFDKFLGIPGLLHSLLTLVPIAVMFVGLEYYARGELEVSPVIVALIFSHLILDFLDGGPVPLFFPLLSTGVGLEYPVTTAFGQGWSGVTFEGPLVSLRTVAPRGGYNTYGFIKGIGVANALLFATIYVSFELGDGG